VIPVREHWALDEFEGDRLGVFVPGAMGAGILLSLGLLLGDAYRKAGGQRLAERRVALTATTTARDVVVGPGSSLRKPPGLRSNAVYWAATALFLGLVAWLVPGATWNYFNPVGYIRHQAWIWGISAVAIVLFAVIGSTVVLAAPRALPVVAGLVGLILTVRFGLLASPGWRLIVIPGLVVLAGVAVYTSHRWARRVDHLPARAWPLLVATPLTRDD
jgi:hypothetical protein